MRTIATEDGITVHALTSGRSSTGSAGINVGGPSVRPLTLPKVLLVVGDDVNRITGILNGTPAFSSNRTVITFISPQSELLAWHVIGGSAGSSSV